MTVFRSSPLMITSPVSPSSSQPQLTSKSLQPTKGYRPRSLTRSLACLVLLQSLCSSVSEAFQCTYPNYNTLVEPGQTSQLTWQANSGDLSTYKSITATLYCMDIDGPKGGIWRTISTLFSNRGLVSAQGQFSFNVPNCGSLARDVAIRIVAQSQDGTSTQNDACYFLMNYVSITAPTSTKPFVPPQPSPTTTNPRVTTNNPTINPTQPTPTATTLGPVFVSSSAGLSAIASGTSTAPAWPSDGSLPTGFGNGGSSRPSNLPPLPPLPDSPSGLGSSNEKSSRSKTIGATLGGLCGFAALVAVASLFILRRRQKRHRHQQGQSSGIKKRLRLQGRRFKNSMKDSNDHFYMMRDDDDENHDGYNHTLEKNRENSWSSSQDVESAMVERNENIPGLVTIRPVSKIPKVFSCSNPPSLLDEISELDLGARRQSSVLSYPPLVHLPPEDWKRSSGMTSLHASDALSLSSSAKVQSDEEEVSSVVRKYWAAATAARAERSRNNNSNPLPSFSSQSRKADILGFEDGDSSTSYSSRAEQRKDFHQCETESSRRSSEDLDAAYRGWVRNPFRSTVNSIQSYVNRSMSTGLQSRLRSFTTFTGSTSSSNFFDQN
ncbi:hypothetical protein BGZ83_008014, partial [Gryganskiella cystojenkinii]